jgi:hypothetical protein
MIRHDRALLALTLGAGLRRSEMAAAAIPDETVAFGAATEFWTLRGSENRLLSVADGQSQPERRRDGDRSERRRRTIVELPQRAPRQRASRRQPAASSADGLTATHAQCYLP